MAHDDFIPILTCLMNCLCLKFANSDITINQYYDFVNSSKLLFGNNHDENDISFKSR